MLELEQCAVCTYYPAATFYLKLAVLWRYFQHVHQSILAMLQQHCAGIPQA